MSPSEKMSSSKTGHRVAVYIDGFNLYHAIDSLGKNHLKWIDMRLLGESFLGKGDTLGSVVLFTAILNWNRDKQQRHRIFVAAQRAGGVEVQEGNFKKGPKYCKAYERYCDFYEEKQTDVAISVRMIADAYGGAFTKAVLITADTDQIPTVEFIRNNFPHLKISIAAPPGRLARSKDLWSRANSKTEITEGRLGTCRLPRNVLDDKGKTIAVMPAGYAKPGEAV